MPQLVRYEIEDDDIAVITAGEARDNVLDALDDADDDDTGGEGR